MKRLALGLLVVLTVGSCSEQKKEQQKEQPKDKMSKDNAEQLLQAAMQQEKNTQHKLQKVKTQTQRKSLQKNW